MKNVVLMGLLLFIIIGGCTDRESQSGVTKNVEEFNVTNNTAEVKQGDFIYRLVSEKAEYKGKEAVKLYATLEYVGDKAEVTLFHGDSPLSFPIVEKTRDYKIEYIEPASLRSAVYKRGVPARTDYTKSGDYAENDPKAYANFIRNLWSNGFPTGYYVVDGIARFFTDSPLGGNQDKYEVIINAQIDFKVVR